MSALRRWAGDLVLGTQNRITALGERVGSPWLVYNPLVLYGFERAARRNAPLFAEALRACMPDVRRVLDVGCGTGEYVARLRDAGLDACGVEFSERLRRRCARKGVHAWPFDLAAGTPPPPGGPFDLAYSLEVAEHVPEPLAGAFVRYVTSTSDCVVFTAAQPGQGGTGHVNEQPREYWIRKFDGDAGFALDRDATDALAAELRRLGAFHYLADNLSVFRGAAPR